MRMMRWAWASAASAALLLAGCDGGFFVNQSSTASSGTGSTVGDYIYVVNQTTDSLSGFSLATGNLVAVSGSPFALNSGLSPTSAVVSRANTFVFVGGNGAIYSYAIGSGGVLSSASGGGITTGNAVVSMATSPDGQWLLALSQGTTTVGAQISVYAINTSTGALTAQSTTAITFNSSSAIGTVVPKAMRISNSGTYVSVALGTAGAALFTFTTSTGVLTQSANALPDNVGGTYLSDNSIAFNSAGTEIFIGTNGIAAGGSYIRTYPITAGGALGTYIDTSTGNVPNSLEVDSTGTYLYAASGPATGSGAIYGYTVSAAGALTALTSSPFEASPTITDLVRDQSGFYMIGVASGGGSITGAADVTLYGFDSYTKGQLDAIGTAVSGTDPAGSVAVGATQ